MVQAARAYDSPFHFTSAKAGVTSRRVQSLAERVAKERYARRVLPDEIKISGPILGASRYKSLRPFGVAKWQRLH